MDPFRNERLSGEAWLPTPAKSRIASPSSASPPASVSQLATARRLRSHPELYYLRHLLQQRKSHLRLAAPSEIKPLTLSERNLLEKLGCSSSQIKEIGLMASDKNIRVYLSDYKEMGQKLADAIRDFKLQKEQPAPLSTVEAPPLVPAQAATASLSTTEARPPVSPRASVSQSATTTTSITPRFVPQHPSSLPNAKSLSNTTKLPIIYSSVYSGAPFPPLVPGSGPTKPLMLSSEFNVLRKCIRNFGVITKKKLRKKLIRYKMTP